MVKVAFLVCNDVLIEVLNYFDRQQLTKAEGLCRRFHRIVVRYFNEAPFLFFEMECYVREEASRFSKILSSPDIDDEFWQFSVVFFSVWNLMSIKHPKNSENYRGRWKGHCELVNTAPTDPGQWSIK